ILIKTNFLTLKNKISIQFLMVMSSKLNSESQSILQSVQLSMWSQSLYSKSALELILQEKYSLQYPHQTPLANTIRYVCFFNNLTNFLTIRGECLNNLNKYNN